MLCNPAPHVHCKKNLPVPTVRPPVVPVPIHAGIDPSDPAAIEFLWHKGEDFVKVREDTCQVRLGAPRSHAFAHCTDWLPEVILLPGPSPSDAF